MPRRARSAGWLMDDGPLQMKGKGFQAGDVQVQRCVPRERVRTAVGGRCHSHLMAELGSGVPA